MKLYLKMQFQPQKIGLGYYPRYFPPFRDEDGGMRVKQWRNYLYCVVRIDNGKWLIHDVLGAQFIELPVNVVEQRFLAYAANLPSLFQYGYLGEAG